MYVFWRALGLAVALFALPAPAQAAVMRSAGWHGREIRAPYPQTVDDATPRFPRGWSAGPVRSGTGFARPSQRVRELQQRLRRRGYCPGRIDGRFGPRTRAAVLWFQIKHGLPRTGRGDARTITRLRDPRRTVRPRPPAPVPTVAAAMAIKPPDRFDTIATALLALVIGIGLVVIAAWVRPALRPRAHTLDEPAPRLELVAPPQDRVAPSPTVLGYVALAKGEDRESAARTIGAWCEGRGWELGKVVNDALPARGRPGLEHALDDVRAGRAAGLVVQRLRDLTDTATELGPLLQWFVEADAFLIALDYELDTSRSVTGSASASPAARAPGWTPPAAARRAAPPSATTQS